MTPDGEQFLRYAPTFLAALAAGPSTGGRATGTSIGARDRQRGDPVATAFARLGCLNAAFASGDRTSSPVDVPQDLITQVAAGLVNAAAMYAPPHRPGLKIGPLALAYILSEGGCGYFRMHAAAPHIASGRLHIVPGMPQFDYPIYAVYSSTADDSLLSPALAGLRAVSSKQSEESLIDRATSRPNAAATEGSRAGRGKSAA